MCMEKDQCESCFSDLQRKGNEFFVDMGSKHELFFDKMEKRHNTMMLLQLFLFGLFASAIAYIGIDLNNKADEKEVVKRTELELLIQQGDEYNRNVFVKQTEIKEDTFTYTSNKNLIFKNGLRGSVNINN